MNNAVYNFASNHPRVVMFIFGAAALIIGLSLYGNSPRGFVAGLAVGLFCLVSAIASRKPGQPATRQMQRRNYNRAVLVGLPIAFALILIEQFLPAHAQYAMGEFVCGWLSAALLPLWLLWHWLTVKPYKS